MNTFLEPWERDSFAFSGAHVAAEHDGSVLLVSPIGSTMIVSLELAAFLSRKDISDEFAAKLVQNFFASFGNRTTDLADSKLPTSFFLIDMTGECNLNCAYCFRDGTDRKPTIAADELRFILDAIRSYCERNGVRKISLQPWGGEPLIASNSVLAIADYFRDTDIDANVSIETNGVLLTDDLVAKLHDRGIGIGISVDGPAWLHDVQRRRRDGSPSYDAVSKGIAAVRRRYGNAFGTISVITRRGIGHGAEIFTSLRDDVGGTSMKLNIVRDNPYAREHDLVPSLDEVRAFYTEVFSTMVESWRAGKPMCEETSVACLRNLLFLDRSNCCDSQGCTGGRSIVSFDHAGRMFPCEITDFDEQCMGSVADSRIEDLVERGLPACFREKKGIERCETCPWWHYCRGGCTSRMLYTGARGVDEVTCAVNETLYPLAAQLILDDLPLSMAIARREVRR